MNGIKTAESTKTADPSTTDSPSAAYDQLYAAWKSSTDWWGNGSILDTLFDHLILTQATTSQLESLAEEGLQIVNVGKGLWFDDFGWWGIAATKGFLKRQDGSYLLGKFAIQYQDMAKTAFAYMNACAPNVWDSFNARYDGKQPGAYEPRYAGGVWNFILDNIKVIGLKGTPNPPYPDNDPLTSRQNSVTNGLYHVLACRLFQHTQDAGYRVAALRHAAFLEQWFKDPNESQRLVYPQSQGVVLRERVGGFKTTTPDKDFNPKIAWAGDQGIFLGALIDHRQAIGQPLTKIFSTVDVLHGVAASMVDKKPGSPTLDKLFDWTLGFGSHISPLAALAYSCGSGVFLRYLTYAYQQDAAIRSAITSSDWLQIIKNTESDPPSPSDGDPNFRLLNILAAQNALLAMSPSGHRSH